MVTTPFNSGTLVFNAVSVSLKNSTDALVFTAKGLGILKKDSTQLRGDLSIDRKLVFEPGFAVPKQDSKETIIVSATSSIIAVNVAPTMTFLGVPRMDTFDVPVFCVPPGAMPGPFEASATWKFQEPQNVVRIPMPANTKTVELSVDHRLGGTLTARIAPHMNQNRCPEATIVLGFSIVSVETT